MAKRTRPINGMQRRYAWRLYPTYEQDEAMREQAGMCADLWNALLEMCERRYRGAIQRCGRGISFHCADCAALNTRTVGKTGIPYGLSDTRPVGKTGAEDEKARPVAETGVNRGFPRKLKLCEAHKLPSEFDFGYWITEMRAECPEWQALSTWTPRRVATSLTAAWQGFFRRAKAGDGASSGYPRYKSRRNSLAIPHRCHSGCAVHKSDRHERSWTIRLAGISPEIWARNALPSQVNEMMDADVRFRDGRWEMSTAVAIDPRRESEAILRPIVVRFDLIDGFAIVNNEQETPEGLIQAQILDDRRADMQSEFDRQWPRGKRWSDDEWQERCEAKAEIGRLAARIARIRRNALHVWSSRLVCRASILTIIKPSIKTNTATPRGDEKEWGAAIKTVSHLNRNTLSYAPAMAVAMLEYKAKEIGIRCEVIEDKTPDIAVGKKLVASGKAIRRLKRSLTTMENIA